MNKIKPNSFQRWYSFNKHKIPFYFMVISAIFITGFLDFKYNDSFKLDSHINAINKITGIQPAFYMFVIYLFSLVQLANFINFSKTKSLKTTIIITLLTLIEIIFYFLYLGTFINETKISKVYVIDSVAVTSLSIFALGIGFMIVGCVFSWIYVDFKYVKPKE